MADDEPPQGGQRESEPSSGAPEQGGSIGELARPVQVPAEIRNVSFPLSVRGYSRQAVDAYVERVNRVIAELEVGSSPRAAVRHALDRVTEQVGGILERARESAEQITASAREEAEENSARAKMTETLAKRGPSQGNPWPLGQVSRGSGRTSPHSGRTWMALVITVVCSSFERILSARIA